VHEGGSLGAHQARLPLDRLGVQTVQHQHRVQMADEHERHVVLQWPVLVLSGSLDLAGFGRWLNAMLRGDHE
jgi:hypothetical protein